MTPADVITPRVCWLPDCRTAPRWGVTDLAGQGQLGACEPHLARLVERKLRREDRQTEDGAARVVVSPLFEVENVADLAPMVAVGAEVYGLVVKREIAALVRSLSDDELDALFRSYGGREALR